MASTYSALFEERFKELMKAPDAPQRGLVNTFAAADLAYDWFRSRGIEPKGADITKIVQMILIADARKETK